MPKAFEERGKRAGPKGKGVGKPRALSVNKRIRDLQRLLHKRGDTFPPEVKAQKEQELSELRAKAMAREEAERERRTVRRYRMLKFIERQKLGRKIRHVERQLQSEDLAPEERTKLEADLDALKNDLLYIAFFPKNMNYLALFPKNPYRNPRSAEKRELLRKEIPKAHEAEKARIVNGVIKVAGDEEDEKEFKHLKKDDGNDSAKEMGSAKKKRKATKESSDEPSPKKPKTDSPKKSPKPQKKDNDIGKGKQKAIEKKRQPERESESESGEESDDEDEYVSGWQTAPKIEEDKPKKASKANKPSGDKGEGKGKEKTKAKQSPGAKSDKKMRSEINQFELQTKQASNRRVVYESSDEDGNDMIEKDDFFA